MPPLDEELDLVFLVPGETIGRFQALHLEDHAPSPPSLAKATTLDRVEEERGFFHLRLQPQAAHVVLEFAPNPRLLESTDSRHLGEASMDLVEIEGKGFHKWQTTMRENPNLVESNSVPESPGGFVVLLYYHYFRPGDPDRYFQVHRDLCERLGLRGRILIGHEGLNGTVSGPAEATTLYQRILGSDPRTRSMPFKVERVDGHVFPKLSVKLRREIVTLGLDPEDDIDPTERTGRKLQPAEWQEAIEDPESVIIDGRNDYEAAIGHFRGAICPDIENFRDFPRWLEEHAGELRGRRILTYCTGGIRCEKLSSLLLREGFEDVSQLDGGIIRYAQDPETRGRNFDGLCYVFDERVAVEVNHTESRRLVSHCLRCGEPSARYRNCAWSPCNIQVFLCEACESTKGRFCGEVCRERFEASRHAEEESPSFG